MAIFLGSFNHHLNGESNPPKFDNWVSMFLDGLEVYVVTVGYFILPLILIL